MIPLVGNIVLKPLCENDAVYIFETINTERLQLRQWMPFVDFTHQIEDSKAFVESVLKTDNKQFCIYDGNKFIGLIGFKDSDTLNKKTEIGYWLSYNAHGKGIMTLAIKALLRYAFEELGFNRVQIKVAVNNMRSRRIPEKLQFTFEGIERDGELLVDNIYTNIAIYSLLKRDYESLCKS